VTVSTKSFRFLAGFWLNYGLHPIKYETPGASMDTRCALFLALIVNAAPAFAVDTSADEARIDALVSTINSANQRPDVPNLFANRGADGAPEATGAETLPNVASIAVPIDDDAGESAVSTQSIDPTTDQAIDAPVTIVEEPELAPGGALKFDDLPKVVGKRIRVRTLSGRTYDGVLGSVRNGEMSLSVRMYGSGSTVMPIKKAQVSAITLL